MILQTNDDETIIICAVRYALPRQSYMPSLIADWLRDNWQSLNALNQNTILRDIKDAIDRKECGSELVDLPMWTRLLDDLTNIKKVN